MVRRDTRLTNEQAAPPRRVNFTVNSNVDILLWFATTQANEQAQGQIWLPLKPQAPQSLRAQDQANCAAIRDDAHRQSRHQAGPVEVKPLIAAQAF